MRALGAARVALVVVEPGTPRGFQQILEARTQALASGAAILAPCPHDATCPMQGSDWCHFAARVERSRTQRQLKGGELGWEDEKFSYVVITDAREAVTRGGSRRAASTQAERTRHAPPLRRHRSHGRGRHPARTGVPRGASCAMGRCVAARRV